jgi:hypothetical protein
VLEASVQSTGQACWLARVGDQPHRRLRLGRAIRTVQAAVGGVRPSRRCRRSTTVQVRPRSGRRQCRWCSAHWRRYRHADLVSFGVHPINRRAAPRSAVSYAAMPGERRRAGPAALRARGRVLARHRTRQPSENSGRPCYTRRWTSIRGSAHEPATEQPLISPPTPTQIRRYDLVIRGVGARTAKRAIGADRARPAGLIW